MCFYVNKLDFIAVLEFDQIDQYKMAAGQWRFYNTLTLKQLPFAPPA